VSEDIALKPGEEIAGYRITRFINRGGMGSVYEAVQLSLERRVALKVIAREFSADERFRDRFRREARAGAAIEHPNILPVYEAGELPEGLLYLALRFVDGPDLRTLLNEHGPLSVQETVEILTQVGNALDAAHEHGLVHRDVKPANVLLTRHGQGWQAFLADFGLAKPHAEASEHTLPGEMLGTVDYMAPEQINGGLVDHRADVYSFGCMVYRCLTGEPPYKRETRDATLLAHVNAPLPIPSHAIAGLPEPLDIVVARALAKDPATRAASAGALMRWASQQLGLAASTHSTAAAKTSEGAPAEAETHAHPWRRQLRASLLTAFAYAPIWAGGYLLGRSL
jgi:serine/threonine protein kinase